MKFLCYSTLRGQCIFGKIPTVSGKFLNKLDLFYKESLGGCELGEGDLL